MHLSIEQLEEKFYADGNVFWKMFRGRTNRGATLSKHLDDEAKLTIDQSFDKLITEISRYESGLVTIETLSSKNAKNGITFQVAWGDDTTTSTSKSNSFNDMQQMMQIMNFFESRSQSNIQTAVAAAEQRISHQYEMQILRGEIAAMSEEPSSPWIDGLEKVAGIVSGMNMRRPQPTHVGVAGGTSPSPNPVKSPPIDLNRLLHTARFFKQMYPQYQVNDLLDRLAVYCRNNKVNADYLINQIMSDETQQNTDSSTRESSVSDQSER
jgi:hypothetical protein